MSEIDRRDSVPLHLGEGAESLLEEAVRVQAQGLALHKRSFTADALPNVWGPAVVVGNAIGVVTYTIEYAAVGGTLVMGRVTFFEGAGGGKRVQREFRDSITITTANAVAAVECQFKGIPLGSAVDGFVEP
jgi:hypothetical protein